ncbi:SH3 domain-containing protein [Streptomyces bacillaris]|uniref:SH3 domain-containing protein n=1 Tax=Streptomyces TaxID=1883 RepID=UPI001C98C2C1|nr:SH3 domain-containing protein [Streptomyces cavourensis]WAE68589.1 SH3 domain-containing protein [Streptomyces cavourensis]
MSPLSRPSRFRRIGLCVATGALAAATAAAPALAADPSPTDHRDHAATAAPASDELSASALQREHEARQDAQAQNQAMPQAPKRTYKGRVIAKPNLLLRDRPTRSSKVVGSVKYGTVVNIFCKTTGDNVDGNNRWYLLTDGTWAWGSARYIENIGAAPRYC